MTLETLIDHEKAEPILLNAAQVKALKVQPDTPKGRHDKLLVCLALNHGLRVSELALLQRSDFYLAGGTVTFDRPKTGHRETHELTDETLEAASNYFADDALGFGNIWRTSLSEQGMWTRAISERIGALGRRIGIDNLSPQDLRHTWAINAAKTTPLDKLIYAGGWASVSAALPYIEKAKIAIWSE
jgi:integrase